MRSLILNRTRSNDLGDRQDRRIVAVNELLAALRASFSFIGHADVALAGYQASLERLVAATAAPAATAPATQAPARPGEATLMSRTLGSFGPEGRYDRQGRDDRPGCWHSKQVPQASERKG